MEVAMGDNLDQGRGPWDTGYDDGRSATGPHGVGYGGRGPRGYIRADDRILDDVCERLKWDPEVDASEITVRVEEGVVKLTGAVNDRCAKRRAEDIAGAVRGVRDVENELRVGRGEVGTSAVGLSGMMRSNRGPAH
jgi:hypothetical protein